MNLKLILAFVVVCAGIGAVPNLVRDPPQRARPVLSENQHATVEALGTAMMSHHRVRGDIVPKLAHFYWMNVPEEHHHRVVEAFVAGLIASDPRMLDRLMPVYQDLEEAHALRLARAIALSGHADRAGMLNRLATLWPKRAEKIKAYKVSPPLAGLDVMADAVHLDWNWAFFGATGSPEPLLRIVSALSGLLETRDARRLGVGFAAKWSLASNAMQQPQVAEFLQALGNGRHGPAIRDALDAAAKRNPDRIKAEAQVATQALAAISRW